MREEMGGVREGGKVPTGCFMNYSKAGGKRRKERGSG